ncbi:MAG: transposase [Alphaproteobacteria bacterium]|nr:transposase [Alphaproteobacteria bacterium]MBM3641750.1 transposase [Alphaproteobacteria bacterium]
MMSRLLSEAMNHERQPLRTFMGPEPKKDLGVSRATAYRMMKTFRTCGAVTAPGTRPVGRPKGARCLDPRREQIIQEAIKAHHSRSLRPRFRALVQEIHRRCAQELLAPPNWRTIRKRLLDVECRIRDAPSD